MSSLHDIPREVYIQLFWTNLYSRHAGDMTGMHPGDHHRCAEIAFGSSNFGTPYCECTVCTRRQPTIKHHFQNSPSYVVTCPLCKASNHPEVPKDMLSGTT